MNNFVVAIVGATGAIGREVLDVLESRLFPIGELRLLATQQSEGEKLEFGGTETVVRQITAESFDGVDIAFFAAGAEVSQEYAPIAAEAGAMVIDSSEAFRLDSRAELIVPEVNSESLRQRLREGVEREGMIVATPSSAATQLVVVLKPLLDRAGIKRLVISTYQSVSDAGQKGLEELSEQVLALFNHKEPTVTNFPHRIAFNCLPQIGSFLEDGQTSEEQNLINETKRILERPDLAMSVTAVQVPTFSCHAESVNLELLRSFTADEAKDLLREAPGIVVMDEPTRNIYPINGELVGTDATYVGRVRADFSVESGLSLWILADNLRKGMAVNMVQIAEVVTAEWSRN